MGPAFFFFVLRHVCFSTVNNIVQNYIYNHMHGLQLKKKSLDYSVLNCEPQFSTYRVITNKATAVSYTTITFPSHSLARGSMRAQKCEKSYAYLYNLYTYSRGFELMKRSYINHTTVGQTSDSSCYERQGTSHTVLTITRRGLEGAALPCQSFLCFLGFTLFSREGKLLVCPLMAVMEPFWWPFRCSFLREAPFLL